MFFKNLSEQTEIEAQAKGIGLCVDHKGSCLVIKKEENSNLSILVWYDYHGIKGKLTHKQRSLLVRTYQGVEAVKELLQKL